LNKINIAWNRKVSSENMQAPENQNNKNFQAVSQEKKRSDGIYQHYGPNSLG
jgi:hypothetical protein